MERPENAFDDPRLTVVGLLVETHGGLMARLAEVHAKYGMTNTDFDALIRLARSPRHQLRMGDLAAQAGLSTSGVTRIVDRLERHGLVHRTRAPGDRRGWLVTTTDAGLARVHATLPDLLAATDRYVTSNLTEPQLDALLDTLHVIRHAVRPGATAGTAD